MSNKTAITSKTLTNRIVIHHLDMRISETLHPVGLQFGPMDLLAGLCICIFPYFVRHKPLAHKR